MSGLRVAHVKSRYGRVGGIESMLAHLLPEQTRAGVAPTLIVIGDDAERSLGRRIAGGAGLRMDVAWRGLARAPQAAAALARALEESGADVAHSHDMRANLLVALALRRRRTPWLCHIHGWLGPTHGLRHRFYERIDARLTRMADLVATGSYATRAEVLAAGAARCRFAWNGVSAPPPPPPEAIARIRAELGASDQTALFALLGRLHRGKGQDVALRALARLPREDAMLVLVGEGEARAGLEALAAELGVSARTRFTGFVDDPLAIAATADVTLAPSLKESLPLTALEGMALGRPVIASAVGDIPLALAGEGVACGVLVPPGEPEALAEAMERLAGDAALRARLGALGRKRIAARHSVTALAARLDAIYAETRALARTASP